MKQAALPANNQPPQSIRRVGAHADLDKPVFADPDNQLGLEESQAASDLESASAAKRDCVPEAAAAPAAPAPVEPAPVEPAPVEPAPVEPAPVEPAPVVVEPAPVVAPVVVEPAPTLAQADQETQAEMDEEAVHNGETQVGLAEAKQVDPQSQTMSSEPDEHTKADEKSLVPGAEMPSAEVPAVAANAKEIVPANPAVPVCEKGPRPDGQKTELEMLRTQMAALQARLTDASPAVATPLPPSRATPPAFDLEDIDGAPLMDQELIDLIQSTTGSGAASSQAAGAEQPDAAEALDKVNFVTHKNEGARMSRFMDSQEARKFPHMLELWQGSTAETWFSLMSILNVFFSECWFQGCL